jgi:oxygen-independent coproporphyrinogen-3 oxidase
MEFHDIMTGSDEHGSSAVSLPVSPVNDTGATVPVENPDEAGFGVYVHWPFCTSKCPYCDFNSHVRAGGIDEQRFLAAYLREIDATADRIGPRQSQSVFFGGGTPSLMSPGTVGSILAGIDRHWPIAADAEITLEANPGSVEAGRFAGYRAAGVDRVSLGVQSLSDDSLVRLGRLHTVAEARSALDIARRTFRRFSFDMIYTRPGQTTEAWRIELAEALDLAGGHLSLYQLTIEDGTPFAALHAAGKLVPPDDEIAGDMFALTQDMTAQAGLPAYEISNHARPGEQSRHNLLYWRYGEYVGIGAGAHGRLICDDERHATTNFRQPERWLSNVELMGRGVETVEPLTAREMSDEALLMGLRLTDGLDLGRLARFGGGLPRQSVLSELQSQGLLEPAGPGRIRASSSGRFLLNGIILKLSESLDAQCGGL